MTDAYESRRLAWERRAEWPLTVLALAFLAAYAVPILEPDLAEPWLALAGVIAAAAWAAFAMDYAVRLALADNRWRFVRNNLLDLAVIVLPVLRPLRLLRLVTVLSVLNRRSGHGFRGRVALYVAAALSLLTFVAGLAVLDAEREAPEANIVDFGDAVWWAMTTATTVGYGDRFPVTTEGRLVAVGLMLAGIALLGVVTATLASWFVERIQASDERTRSDVEMLVEEVRRLSDLLAAQAQPTSAATTGHNDAAAPRQ